MGRSADVDEAPFDRLLAVLDPDRDRAGERYERLRAKLITFFEWRGADTPEDLADRTFERVARKLDEGEVIREASPSGYVYGIARNILREHWSQRTREKSARRAVAASDPAADEEETADRRLRCLEACLAALRPRSRELILGYYEGERRVKIENRQALAERLDIPLNALRIRACRVRLRLEECVRKCLADGETK